jgi:ATP-binding cassette subfamily G (WHITE) protein 2 (PDR)
MDDDDEKPHETDPSALSEKPHPSYDTSETASLSRTRTQEEKRDDELHELARRYTSQSAPSTYTKNPFDAGQDADSVLNPHSANFSPRAFAKSLLNLQARDPEKWQGRTAGFAFRGLSVYGFGSDTDYQKDVVSLCVGRGGDGDMLIFGRGMLCWRWWGW